MSSSDEAKKVLVNYGLDSFTIGRIVQSMASRGILAEAHDDNTMRKVYDTFIGCGYDETEAMDVITELQNAGILFRERW